MPNEIINDGKYPIISVVQTDVVYYGHDIWEFLEMEFLGNGLMGKNSSYGVIPFWTDLIFQIN